MHDEFLLRDGKLYVPNCSLSELLVCEVHSKGLMGNFRMIKTSNILYEHFY